MRFLIPSLVLAVAFVNTITLQAQRIQGILTEHASQEISLTAFDYYDSYILAKTTTDSLGRFSLDCYAPYKGVAILKTQDRQSLVVIIDQPNIQINGKHLSDKNSVSFTNSNTNKSFFDLAAGYQSRASAYKAWRYLNKKYANSDELKGEVNIIETIQREIERIENKNTSEIKEITNSYLQWYMPKRKLLSDISSIRDFPERIDQLIAEFRSLDFTEDNYKTSGLTKELIEAHYYLLENMGLSLEEMAAEMNLSTQKLITTTANKPLVLNIITKELFQYFEKHSLYSSSMYLAKQLLFNEAFNNKIEDEFKHELQKYGDMNVGNTAPDIQLNSSVKLSELNKNILLVFKQGDYAQGIKEVEHLTKFYGEWKEKLEIVYVGLNTQESEFKKIATKMPWLTYFDDKTKKTTVAEDYHINASTSYLLIDKNMKILLHPTSLGHINAWVKYKL